MLGCGLFACGSKVAYLRVCCGDLEADLRAGLYQRVIW